MGDDRALPEDCDVVAEDEVDGAEDATLSVELSSFLGVKGILVASTMFWMVRSWATKPQP